MLRWLAKYPLLVALTALCVALLTAAVTASSSLGIVPTEQSQPSTKLPINWNRLCEGHRKALAENLQCPTEDARRTNVQTAAHEVIVQFTPDATPHQRAQIRKQANLQHPQSLANRTLQSATTKATDSPRQVAKQLAANPQVAYAQPNYIYHVTKTPSADLFPYQWGLTNSGQPIMDWAGTPGADVAATKAWNQTTGSADIQVGVLDTGVDSQHPGLKGNILPGRNFVKDRSPSDTEDHHGHGTHVAGIIGATGAAGDGTIGLNWNISIIPLRALDDEGYGDTREIVRAIHFAGEAGLATVNMSLGGPGYDFAMAEAIKQYPHTLFVAAAGNENNDNDTQVANYPCGFPLSNVLCVAATDQDDRITTFSNWGKRSVDLAAPGENILSTFTCQADSPKDPGCPGGQGLNRMYAFLSGTSMAAPFVTGAAALLWAARPTSSVGLVRQAIVSTVDRLPCDQLSCDTELVASSGRLNVARALASINGELRTFDANQSEPLTAPEQPAPSEAQTAKPALAPAAKLPLQLAVDERIRLTRANHKSYARLQMRCQQTEPCRLGIKLLLPKRNATGWRKKAHGTPVRHTVVLGKVSLKLAPGSNTAQRVPLTRQARNYLRRSPGTELQLLALPMSFDKRQSRDPQTFTVHL